MPRYLIHDGFGDQPVPRREEFESWTIRQRHNFIKQELKQEFGRNILKTVSKNTWIYAQICADSYLIRFKLDRKGEIYSVETHDIDRFPDLMGQYRLAEAAIKASN